MVSDDGSITGILDWESAGFYPRVWISTKLKVSYCFTLEDVGGDKWAWSKPLSAALKERCFVADVEGFTTSIEMPGWDAKASGIGQYGNTTDASVPSCLHDIRHNPAPDGLRQPPRGFFTFFTSVGLL